MGPDGVGSDSFSVGCSVVLLCAEIPRLDSAPSARSEQLFPT